jgi:glycosyltransferase involved in cell wall biosynthesis
VVGTVGRLAGVKDQLTLVRAFIAILRSEPSLARRLRLVIVGDGPLREPCLRELEQAGIAQYAWLPGERRDIRELMRGFDLFVLPSIAEGISNTILEAMATGLPIVATRVGGNPELVEDGVTGCLVRRREPSAMAGAIREYLEDPAAMRRHGEAARRKVERSFGLDAMVSAYLRVYDAVSAERLRPAPNGAGRGPGVASTGAQD